MAEKTILKMVDARGAIERLKDIVQVLFQVDQETAVDIVAVGKTAEMYIELAPHLDVLRAVCVSMIEQVIKVQGPACADEPFLALTAALAALESVSLPRLCRCGKCAAKPEAERMPDGAVTH